MTEQEHADALAEQLDALLTGKTPASAPPGELTDLLHVANQLSETAPAPRLEFGPALKESLLKTAFDGAAAATAGSGSSLSGAMVAMIVGGFVIVLVVLGLVAGSVWSNRATPTPGQNPTPAVTPAEAGATPPAAESTAAPQATLTNQAADTLTLPSPLPSPTIILDVMPAITLTVEATGQAISLPELVPGQPSSSGSNGGTDDNSSGDHDRGHGNDSDHHDEDNPGRSHND